MPDSWAIKPAVPHHAYSSPERAAHRHAILGDISCDSDGKIDQFIDRRDVKRTLPLHPFNGEPYYLGAFLLGAYQEILGDLHNLFGDTNAVHVSLGENGEVILDNVIKGDTVREVLEYVQFNSEVLLSQFRRDVEAALREGRIGYEESGRLLRFYEEGLYGYTYLTIRCGTGACWSPANRPIMASWNSTACFRRTPASAPACSLYGTACRWR
jgi:arginine decarboxylase